MRARAGPLAVAALALGISAATASVPLEQVVDPWHDPAPGEAPLPLEPAPRLRSPLWQTDELSLTLEGAGEAGLELCLELRSGAQSVKTSIGPARYRTRTGRWQGIELRAPAGPLLLDAQNPRACFHVPVAAPSTLRLALGGEIVEIGSLERAADPLPPPAPHRESPPPGAPVRLRTAVRWDGARPFGDGALDAGEQGELLVDIANEGERVASQLVLSIEPAIDHVVFPASLAVPEIAPGATATLRVPFRAGADLADATLRLVFGVREPFGHDAPPLSVELPARAEPRAELELTDDLVVAGYGLPAPRDAILTLRLRVRNVGAGTARQTVAAVSPGEGVFATSDTEERFELGDLAPGETAELEFRCYANRQAAQLALEVELGHARSRGAPSRALLTLPLEDDYGPARVVRIEAEPRAQAALAPPPPPLVSDVDRAVPQGGVERPAGLAVVLGVERYAGVPPARFGADDARTAARYFEQALGIPRSRIQLLLEEDVTLAGMQRVFGPGGWLARRAASESDVFVFFAGHGVSEPEKFEPYLLPADGDPSYLGQTALPVGRLIEWLSALEARSTSLFLDACFSGLTRGGATLFEGARPLVVVPVERKATARVSVYSAARGGQIAGTLDAQGHGLFSYYLFKGLQGEADLDGDRRVSAGEVALYLEREVPAAAAEHDREQDPSIVLDDENRTLLRLP